MVDTKTINQDLAQYVSTNSTICIRDQSQIKANKILFQYVVFLQLCVFLCFRVGRLWQQYSRLLIQKVNHL